MMRIRHRRQRGVMLGIVMVLLLLVFAAGVFALWSLRSETSSAGSDRISRQLFDCAEQGLAWGKQYFSQNPQLIDNFLGANICATQPAKPPALVNEGPLPCWDKGGPFPTQAVVNGAPPAGYPITTPITMDQRLLQSGTKDFEWTVGIVNDPEDIANYGNAGWQHDHNSAIIVYSRCTDVNTLQQRSVQALIQVTPPATNDYHGQAGRGFRNQGNSNFAGQ